MDGDRVIYVAIGNFCLTFTYRWINHDDLFNF